MKFLTPTLFAILLAGCSPEEPPAFSYVTAEEYLDHNLIAIAESREGVRVSRSPVVGNVACATVLDMTGGVTTDTRYEIRIDEDLGSAEWIPHRPTEEWTCPVTGEWILVYP